MGTRADFYVDRGKEAEWLGSIAWDGDPSSIDKAILAAVDTVTFRRAVDEEIASRDDGTNPEMGWPWPWKNSGTTDFAYALDDGKVYGSCFGSPWFDPNSEPPEDGWGEQEGAPAIFPEFPIESHAKAGDKRSGVIAMRLKR